MNRYILLLLCFVCFFLLSCASTQKNFEISGNESENSAEEEIENIQDRVLSDISNVQKSNNYILQSGDLVEIKVFMEDNMDRVLRISSDGMVTFPLVGNVKIGGYSVSEAEQQLSEKLKYYIKNPFISAFVEE